MKPRIFCGILPLSASDPLPRRRVIPPSFPDDQTSPPHIHSFLWKSVPATIFLLLELLPTPPSSLPAEPPGKPKNTGVGSLSLLQRIFLIQESNGSPALQADSLPTELSGKPPVLLQCGRPGFDPWDVRIPWRRERLPTPVFWPGEFHGLYSPWGSKESATTERLSLSLLCPDPPVSHAGASLPEKAPPDHAAPWGRVSSSLLLSQSDCLFPGHCWSSGLATAHRSSLCIPKYTLVAKVTVFSLHSALFWTSHSALHSILSE